MRDTCWCTGVDDDSKGLEYFDLQIRNGFQGVMGVRRVAFHQFVSTVGAFTN